MEDSPSRAPALARFVRVTHGFRRGVQPKHTGHAVIDGSPPRSGAWAGGATHVSFARRSIRVDLRDSNERRLYPASPSTISFGEGTHENRMPFEPRARPRRLQRPSR